MTARTLSAQSPLLLPALLFFSMALALPRIVCAQTSSPGWVTIVNVGTGWATDAFMIRVDKPVINPANCNTTDGYVSDSNNGGHKTHYAAALMAFSLGKQVQVTVHNSQCVHGRPLIIGLMVS